MPIRVATACRIHHLNQARFGIAMRNEPGSRIGKGQLDNIEKKVDKAMTKAVVEIRDRINGLKLRKATSRI